METRNNPTAVSNQRDVDNRDRELLRSLSDLLKAASAFETERSEQTESRD